eukprot:3649815-Heterocapsa_arctica.AAC.1
MGRTRSPSAPSGAQPHVAQALHRSLSMISLLLAWRAAAVQVGAVTLPPEGSCATPAPTAGPQAED